MTCKARYYNSSQSILDFKWRNRLPSATNQSVYRKLKNTLTWGSVYKSLSTTDTSFSDTISTGNQYEYEVQKDYGPHGYSIFGYVLAGNRVPAIVNRGKIILVIDSTNKTYLDTAIRTLRNDLVGDGWQTIVKYFSPSTTVKQIKAYILSTYKSDPLNVKSLLIIGDLAVPYSGNFYDTISMNYEPPPDGHSHLNSPGASHEGAWPADCYYGDMLTDSLWTDTFVNNTFGSRAANKNISGDGKFDNSIIPYLITLQVGRLDLSDMTAFSLSERDLLKQYLKRNHDYRHKVFNVKERCLLDDNFGVLGGIEDMGNNAYRNMAPLINDTCTKALDYLTNLNSNDYLWSFGYGFGAYNWNQAIGYTADLANSSQSVKSVFSGFFGSYFVDWDNTNNFLKAPLAAKGYVLNTFNVGRPHWFFHHMGMGETIGFSTMISQNNLDTGIYYLLYPSVAYSIRDVHTALMGDPTIRMQPVEPAKNFVVVQDSCSLSFKLKWQSPSDTAVHDYYVFRAKHIDSTFSLLGSTSNLTYIDNSPLSGNNIYMLRDMKLQLSGSGTYYNMGQGLFDTINTNDYYKPIANAGRDTSICANQKVRIGTKNNNSINTIYQWQPGLFSTDTVTITANTTSNRILLAIDTLSKCTVKDTMFLTAMRPVSETLTATPLNSCKDTTSWASSLNNGNGFNYNWQFNGGSPGTLSGPVLNTPGVITYGSTGSFYTVLKVTDTLTNCSHRDTLAFTISCLQALPLKGQFFNCETLVNGSIKVSFANLYSSEIKQFYIEGLTKQNEWQIIRIVQGNDFSLNEVETNINSYSAFRIMGVFPNLNIKQLDLCIPENTIKSLKLYPNPVNEKMTLSMAEGTLNSNGIKIYNAYGAIISLPLLQVNSNTIEIDGSGLSAGQFIILVISGEHFYKIKFSKI